MDIRFLQNENLECSGKLYRFLKNRIQLHKELQKIQRKIDI